MTKLIAWFCLLKADMGCKLDRIKGTAVLFIDNVEIRCEKAFIRHSCCFHRLRFRTAYRPDTRLGHQYLASAPPRIAGSVSAAGIAAEPVGRSEVGIAHALLASGKSAVDIKGHLGSVIGQRQMLPFVGREMMRPNSLCRG